MEGEGGGGRGEVREGGREEREGREERGRRSSIWMWAYNVEN